MSDASAKPAGDMTGFSRAEYNINGVKTVVHSIGSGPEFVFLHGTGTFTGFEFARAWASRRKVIVPYNPNFGDLVMTPGSTPSRTMSFTTWTCSIGSAWTKFDLGGFSLGGWLAAEFALRQPERLRRLVLVAPAGLVVDKARAPELSEITPPELPSYLANDVTAALRYFPKRQTRPSMLVSAVRLGLMRSSSATIRRAIRSSPAGCTGSRSPRSCAWGAADRMRPTAQADAWMDLLPDGHLELVSKTGHLVFEETPLATALVADFLAA